MEDSGGHRPEDQAAARADRRTSTTCTSTSSPSGIRTIRRCSRSATAASRPPSRPPSATARTGARRSPKPASTRDFYIFRDRSRDAVLPWDIIDGGMKAAFFHAEYEKGLREEWTLPPKRAQENARLLPDALIESVDRSAGDRRPLLVFLKRLENQLAQLVLRRRVHDRAQQREAAPLAVDAVLTRRKRDVAARAAAAALPDRRSRSASDRRADLR